MRDCLVMTRPIRNIAVIDVGKTNAKVVLVEADTGAELALRTTRTVVRSDGPYPHFDVPLIWDFVTGALAEIRGEHPIDAISTTAHGSAGAFLSGAEDGDGLALPILDYEHTGPDEFYADYDAARPDFSETLSPRLPAGLNLGAQIFWQERRFARIVDGVENYVTYPQYWGWRLSGVAATEMCSIGAHSDMWDPRKLTWSSMAERLGWRRFLSPLRSAFDRLARVRPELARKLGLDPATPVFCGIHDSSASLLPHLKERTPPFTVVSTGTWVILFAVGGDLAKLDPRRDTLANVTAYGDPVPVGRFMAGREFEMLTGGAAADPSEAEVARVLDGHIMALPTFVPGVGPFPKAKGRWSHDPAPLTDGERSAAASLYLALVTAASIQAAGGSGPVVIEGPFARNRVYCSALAAILGREVEVSDTGTGTTIGTLMTATGKLPKRPPARKVSPLSHPELRAYVEAWQMAAGQG
jgi:sugar (pentulose or hexulose) kinase